MITYLACPYSDPDPLVCERRFQCVNRVAAELMRKGYHIFSPISHTHPIALAGALPKGWTFWKEYDEKILAVCGQVIVLCLPGWQESVGVQAEIQIATGYGIQIEYIHP